jgi:hypothetical protein
MSIPSIKNGMAYYLGVKAVHSKYQNDVILINGKHYISYIQFENKEEAGRYYHDTQIEIHNQVEAINNAWRQHNINNEERQSVQESFSTKSSDIH